MQKKKRKKKSLEMGQPDSFPIDAKYTVRKYFTQSFNGGKGDCIGT